MTSYKELQNSRNGVNLEKYKLAKVEANKADCEAKSSWDLYNKKVEMET